METDNNQKSLNMIDRFITGMFLPREYEKLLKEKNIKLFSYLLVLVLLISVIKYAIPVGGTIAGMGGIKSIVLEKIPDFSLDKGVMHIDETYEIKDENSGVYLLVDTDKEKYDQNDYPTGMVEAIMVGSREVTVYNDVAGIGTVNNSLFFEDLKDITLNNKILADKAFIIWIYLFILFVFTYIFQFFGYMLMCVFFAAVMMVLAKVMLDKITFGEMYKISLYAYSVGALVMAITICIGIPTIALAGEAFGIFITMVIINRVLLKKKAEKEI